MTVIIIIIAILFLILIRWSWHSLGKLEKTTKIKYIIVGIILIYLLTFIIFNISKSGINYDSQDIMRKIRIIFVLIFTTVNGFIILPYIYRNIDKIKNDEIEKRQLLKNIRILIIAIVILIVIEIMYLKNIQYEILNRINS